MPFNSYEFLFGFLPVAVCGFWLLIRFAGNTAALGWLILASVAFYAYNSPLGLAIIAPSIVLDYFVANALLRADESAQRLRNALFAGAVTANILFLGYFKYRNLVLDTLNSGLSTHFELTSVIVPLGISFITFQKIAFLADVRSGRISAVRLPDFLLFTLFFPRAVAGPIVHYNEVTPQLRNCSPRDFVGNAAVAVCLFSIGLFKKAVVADGVAQFVPGAFDIPVGNPPPALLTAWTGILAYTLQLYFDFSGYSDMALGLARIFGVRLPMNFNSPLKASSIVEFWSRWHITLTRFLTDYLYTPMVLTLTRARMAGGNTVLHGKHSTFSAIAILVALPTMVTMVISGIWHGTGLQFVVWGLLHGVYLTINQAWRLIRPRFWPDRRSYDRAMKPFGFALTFTSVVVALVFFRASSIASALTVLGGMTGMNGVLPKDIQLLRNHGVSVPWSMLEVFQPVAPFVWIIVLLLAVTLLPNSLEILRRFQPALDFEVERRDVSDAGTTSRATAGRTSLPRSGFRAARDAFSAVYRDGISLSGLSATVAAILGILGLIAMNDGGAFLYGQF